MEPSRTRVPRVAGFSASRLGNGPSTPDLTADHDVTVALENPEAWRSRAVEELTITSARVCNAHWSLQVAPLSELVRHHVGAAARVRLMLPLQEMRKRPLLDFDVQVDGQPAYLAKRAAIAQVEASHVVALAEAEGVEIDESVRQLVTAICEFTPAVWRTYRRSFLGRLSRRRAVWKYLSVGLRPLGDRPTDDEEESSLSRVIGPVLTTVLIQVLKRMPSLLTRYPWIERPDQKPFDLPADDYEHWCTHAESIGRILRLALHEGNSDWSSGDDPLLAVPLLADRGHVTSIQEITEMLIALDGVVKQLADSAEDQWPGNSRALRTLAGYGRRWKALAWCDVPVDRPFLASSSQELSVSISARQRVRITPVPLADALSNHLAVHVRDGNVEMPVSRSSGSTAST